jgi:hypothetical protein
LKIEKPLKKKRPSSSKGLCFEKSDSHKLFKNISDKNIFKILVEKTKGTREKSIKIENSTLVQSKVNSVKCFKCQCVGHNSSFCMAMKIFSDLKEDSLAYVPSSNPKEHSIFKEIEIIDL